MKITRRVIGCLKAAAWNRDKSCVAIRKYCTPKRSWARGKNDPKSSSGAACTRAKAAWFFRRTLIHWRMPFDWTHSSLPKNHASRAFKHLKRPLRSVVQFFWNSTISTWAIPWIWFSRGNASFLHYSESKRRLGRRRVRQSRFMGCVESELFFLWDICN